MSRKFNFRQVSGARKYRKWNEWDEGDYIIGKLEDTYQDKFKKECYIVQIIEADFKKKEDEFKEGDLVGLNHAGGLAFALEMAPLKSVVRIEYTGKDILSSGDYEGSEVHTFKVGVDDTGIEVTEIKAVQDAKETELDEEADYDL